MHSSWESSDGRKAFCNFHIHIHIHIVRCKFFQDIKSWAVIDPLPSYGHGRDTAGGRYISLIFGTNLTDVVITGNFINS